MDTSPGLHRLHSVGGVENLEQVTTPRLRPIRKRKPETEKMKTETEVNKYVSDLNRYGADLTAEALLGLMRADVNIVFTRHGMDTPQSQSYRALRLLEEIKAEIKTMVTAKHPLDDDLKQLFRDRDMLKDFLAVHRTVWILEGRPV